MGGGGIGSEGWHELMRSLFLIFSAELLVDWVRRIAPRLRTLPPLYTALRSSMPL